MTNLLTVFLMMGGDPKNPGGSSSYTGIIMIVLMIGVIYLFMFRPRMKQKKEQKLFRENLKKGDKIVTIGGLHGKIIEVQDTTFTIETEGQTKLRFEKSAIASKFDPESMTQK